MKYKYTTEMAGQKGKYIVKFKTKKEQKEYLKKAKKLYPYFRILRENYSGEINE